MISLVNQLNAHFAKEFPEHRVKTSIRRVTQENYAETYFRDGTFYIAISPKVCNAARLLLLIHEWAHVLSWETDKHHSDHGPPFGLAYARVYRSYLKWTVHS